ncbi:MAG: two-component sensor histidine kinase [Acidobacteria bacterium]|nr:two-component sensor histidine kinase [Acidobacteriota bacterium]
MFSNWRNGIVRTFGARIALWYFALFAVGALVILLVAGLILSRSLARRDREALLASLVRYTDAYSKGGVTVLDGLVAADRAAGTYEPVFVRVIAGGRIRMLSIPVEWSRFNLNDLDPPGAGASNLQQLPNGGREALEVASSRLRDGTLFQVGRSTARRDAVIERYRDTGFLLFALVVLVGLAGGLTLTTRALQPLHELTAAILRILQTGRTSERVAVQGTADPLDALGTLVNRMLERIDGLVQGMRSTLDNVAHDLRTPMTRLRGTAEMALQSGRTTEEYREALADCLEEVDRVTGLLDALMDLAEAETGSMRLRRDVVPLVDVVRDAVGLYDEVAEDKGLTLAVEADLQAGTLTGDRPRLTQAFANLMDNAIKYTPAPGSVHVTVRAAHGGIEVVVTDTGVGISADDRPRIWDRLYRGDQSRSERGLGIGLSLVRAIIEAHGGRVSVESEPGHGSRFRVWLPRDMTQM